MCHIRSYKVASPRVVACHVTSCHVMSCHVRATLIPQPETLNGRGAARDVSLRCVLSLHVRLFIMLDQLNSFQTTPTPKAPGPEKFCNTSIQNTSLSVLSKRFQIPVPVVWRLSIKVHMVNLL